MNDITLDKDTEAVIQTVLNLLKAITWRYGVDCGKLVADIADEAEAERVEQEEINSLIVDASGCVFGYLKQMEDDHGGGYINMGPSKALSLMAQGNLEYHNLKTFFEGHKTIIGKLVLMDASRRGKEELEKFGSICSEFAGKKRRVA